MPDESSVPVATLRAAGDRRRRWRRRGPHPDMAAPFAAHDAGGRSLGWL